jgi:hypothetical protein
MFALICIHLSSIVVSLFVSISDRFILGSVFLFSVTGLFLFIIDTLSLFFLCHILPSLFRPTSSIYTSSDADLDLDPHVDDLDVWSVYVCQFFVNTNWT